MDDDLVIDARRLRIVHVDPVLAHHDVPIVGEVGEGVGMAVELSSS